MHPAQSLIVVLLSSYVLRDQQHLYLFPAVWSLLLLLPLRCVLLLCCFLLLEATQMRAVMLLRCPQSLVKMLGLQRFQEQAQMTLVVQQEGCLWLTLLTLPAFLKWECAHHQKWI